MKNDNTFDNGVCCGADTVCVDTNANQCLNSADGWIMRSDFRKCYFFPSDQTTRTFDNGQTFCNNLVAGAVIIYPDTAQPATAGFLAVTAAAVFNGDYWLNAGIPMSLEAQCPGGNRNLFFYNFDITDPVGDPIMGPYGFANSIECFANQEFCLHVVDLNNHLINDISCGASFRTACQFEF